MTDEQAKDMILRAIQNAGVEVVTDKQVMESVLGESLWNKTVAACIEKQVITYAEGERKPDLHMVPLSVKNARGQEPAHVWCRFLWRQTERLCAKTDRQGV